MKLIKDMTEQDFIDAGYTKYHSLESEYDYFYKKLISDKVGKKYHIELYFYSTKKYRGYYSIYTAQVSFFFSEPFVIVKYDHAENYTINYIEGLFEKQWKLAGKPHDNGLMMKNIEAIKSFFARCVNSVEK